MAHDLAAVASQFRIDGRFLDAAPHGTGHINDTYASRFQTPRGVARYVHQRINHNVFREPERLMENIHRVTVHLRRKIEAAGGDAERETLNLMPALDGRMFCRDGDGNWWRTYHFIEGARTYDVAESLDHVESAARAFGRFQRMISDLPGPRLHETIPDFHNTPSRLRAFAAAMEQDAANRAAACKAEIDFVLAREDIAPVLVNLMADSTLPERITHNDTKLNNVMIDDATGEGLCVIDLDTVMPGLALYDFGDSVRLGANPAAEDERDLSKVSMDLERFDRLARGYLGAAGDLLTPAEIGQLAFSARLITWEIGLRFLTDHLAGDVYFKVHRPGHNLDRCRTQFKMVADMEAKADAMEAVVRRYAG